MPRRLADSRLAELAKSVPLELDLRGPALRDSAKEHGCRPYDQQQRKRKVPHRDVQLAGRGRYVVQNPQPALAVPGDAAAIG